ncbi:MAG: hypothetical protein KME08_10900 [Aphanothece sp. CMT-3BRIN-NPC111]|jgi:hypothetical protein|nr:hypothetical protein [Aphanothece sp. CMT-3BRIN-NPC111]
MNTQYTQNAEDFEFDPRARYYQTQLHLLNDREGKHDAEPSKTALVFSVGLSAVEAAVAFFLLSPAGWLIASTGAMFPVFLLWAMANFQADRVELPKKYDELVEQYHDSNKSRLR